MAKKSTNNFDLKRLMDNSGSYRNLIYGVITVVILFVIIFLGIRTLSQNQGDINDGAVTIDEESQMPEYTVAAGDSLWSISEEVYGTGFNWQLIADANNLESPNDIAEGMTLTIPELTPTASAIEESEDDSMEAMEEPEVSPSPTTVIKQESTDEKPKTSGSTDTEYTVVHGDSLWKIAVAQYGDGYKWVEIAKANNLDNPDIIHAGNNLAIPR